jgi:O-antigen/teichoic acid export membrane protein
MTGSAKARMLGNSLWSTVGSLSPAIVGLIASIVAARVLGPSQFGRYVYAVFLYTTAAQIAVWGLPGALMRFVAVASEHQEVSEERAVVARAMLAGMAGTALASAGLLLLAGFDVVPHSSASVVAAAVVLTLAPTQLMVSLLVGREAFRKLALWQLAVGAVNPVVTVVVLLLGGRVLSVLLVDATVTAGSLLVLLRLAQPLWVTTDSPAPAGFWRFSIAYAALILLSIVVFSRSEIVVLEAMRSNRAVALYGVAFGVSQLVPRLVGPALTVLTPAFARMQVAPDDAMRVSVQRALNLAIVLGAALSALGASLGPSLVHLLYGARYQDAETPAALLLAVSWLVMVNAVITPVAQGGRHMRFLVLLNGAAAVVNIAAAIGLVFVAGVLGAAVANAIAQGLVTVGLLVWVRQRLPGLSLRTLALVVPAAAATFILGAVAAHFTVPLVALALGGVVALPAFLVVARITRAIDDESLALLPERLRARLPV